MGASVNLDFSKAQPLNPPQAPAGNGGVSLDFTKATPIAQPAAPTDPARPTFMQQWQGEQAAQAKGVQKNLAEVAQTGMSLVHHIPGLGEKLDNSQLWQRGKQAVDEAATQELTGSGKAAYIGTDIAGWGLGEEALKGLTGLTSVMKGKNYAEKLKSIQPLLTFAAAHPVAGRIIYSALKNAGLGGAMEAAHGKSAGEVATAAATGGMLAGGGQAIAEGAGAAARALKGAAPTATRTVEGVAVPEAAAAELTPAQKAASEAYTKTAREVARPHLNAMSDPWEVDHALQQRHDFTGVAEELKSALGERLNAIDAATGGKFKPLQEEIRSLQSQVGPEADAALKSKLHEMDALLDQSQTTANPDELRKIKQNWRTYYVLRDAGRKLDAAIDGIPGASGVSQQQRGINGKKLLTGISGLVRKYDRAGVEAAIGRDRLDNLEAIGRATMTNGQRQAFNDAAINIAKYITRKGVGAAAGASVGHAVGHAVGGPVGSVAGGAAGAAAGTKLDDAVVNVYKAVQANPKIAKQVLFAIESGARPERYGPFIGGLISAAGQQ